MGPKLGGAKSTHPCGPLGGQLPIVWFWAREGEWGCGIGREGCPAVCILGGGYGKAHRMYFWEGLSQKKRVALRAPVPSRCATGLDAPLLSGYIGE